MNQTSIAYRKDSVRFISKLQIKRQAHLKSPPFVPLEHWTLTLIIVVREETENYTETSWYKT